MLIPNCVRSAAVIGRVGVGTPMTPLAPQRLVNVHRSVGVQRIGGIERGQYLRDLAVSVDLAQRVHHVVDLKVDRCIKHSESAANRGLLVLERIPREAHARREVRLVGRHRRDAIVHLVPQSEIQAEVGRRLPAILRVTGIQREEPGNNARSKALLIALGKAQVECLQGRHRDIRHRREGRQLRNQGRQVTHPAACRT